MGSILGEANLNQNLNVAVPSSYLIPLVERAKKEPMLLKPLSADGVTGAHLTWGPNFYEFSLRNQRPEDIWVWRCLVLFYGKKGELICADEFDLGTPIDGGDASRERRYSVSSILSLKPYRPDRSTEDPISDRWSFFNSSSIKSLVENYEVRILDLSIINPNLSRGNSKNLEGVSGGNLTWLEDPPEVDLLSYTFSLHNQLSEAVDGVKGRVIFYDEKDDPIDSNTFNVPKIPAGKTVRVKKDTILSSVKRLTKRVDIKILDFKIVE